MDQIGAPQRPRPLNSGPERDQLESWLEFYRATLLTKCAGLSLAQLTTRAVTPSRLTLLGLVRHMSVVEQIWFPITFAGEEVSPYYRFAEDRDAPFDELDGASLDDVVALYEAACRRSRDVCAGHGLDEMAALERRGRAVDLRWIFVHMIEEYARHCGHADLLRELIDGETGY
jgi:Protein of unknown function (DUF664)